jgi:site-specific DNA-methyltransferase (adenine-specific)
VANIAKPQSILLMWTTMPMLEDALRIMTAWGFEYKTNAFTWVKVNKKDLKPTFGIGYYTKSNVELCLLGSKGGKALKPQVNDVSSVILHPPMEFAHKPPEAMERIDRMYPHPRFRKVELFSKEKYEGEGWTQMEYKNPSKEAMERNLDIEKKNTPSSSNPPPGIPKSIHER